jgi:protein-L-isoaspartate(D-aspartate) O-methyltransferase
LVIPVGGARQELYLVQRQGDSQEFVEERIEPVKFVPLLGGLSH